MESVYVYEVKLPKGIREMVSPDAEDGYTIYIDRRLSDPDKLKAYRHALRHCRGDFSRASVQDIEKDAHRT